jgi:archaellum biogenesis ATPase FlaH
MNDMIKNKQQLQARQEFVAEAFNDPQSAAEHLTDLVEKLKRCRKQVEIIDVLQDILYLSPETLYKDYLNK